MAQREYRRILFSVQRLRTREDDRIPDNPMKARPQNVRERSLRQSTSFLAPARVATHSAAAKAVRSIKHAFRRMFDAVCAAAGLALLAPVFAMVALAIKLDDGGPVLYSHFRVGKGLREFRLFKFRSMVSNPAAGSTVTAPQDARVTRVGHVIRKYKLDELPQLLNVLKGDMQLVGVRPQVERFVVMFHEEYEELLQSAPGITDLATLSFRNEERLFHRGSIEEQYIKRIMPAKLKMSLKYSRRRTFHSDLDILFRTVLGFQSPFTLWDEPRFDVPAPPLSKFASRNTM